MQEMCGFETTARGSSPWCDIFTDDNGKKSHMLAMCSITIARVLGTPMPVQLAGFG